MGKKQQLPHLLSNSGNLFALQDRISGKYWFYWGETDEDISLTSGSVRQETKLAARRLGSAR